ncbi:hypothetical protein B0H13DRAFT_1597352 [Mycena leptocephala]|nr:hypothetical protein B0H13DRAFT_1597352 [Mycena leptocephala]
MESVDPEKRVTRSQLPLPDSHLSLNRSPLKDARIAQRNYHMNPTEPVQDDGDTDDEILLSPGKNRHFNSQVNTNSKRSASPPPQDEYKDSTVQQDGRELKRLKWDTEENEKRTKHDAEAAEGSDIENTDTNVRTTAAPSHTRNFSDPVVGSSRKPPKPRSTSKQTPASPKGKGRARSVPVFPVLDLSNPPTTPWSRRARSRSPSKERDSPKLQITFSSLASIPDEAGMPPPVPPSVGPPTAPEAPTMPPPPVIIEPPSTPVASSAYNTVFATPMSPLTPLPETPRPFQARPAFEDGFPRTIGWDTQLRTTAEASKPTKAPAQSRLPRPSTTQSAMGPPPVPVASNPTTKKGGAKASSKLMAPPPVPVPSSSSSTSTSGAPKNAFNLMMASSARGTAAKGKGKGKGKEKERTAKPKASVKAKMRPREKPKPLPPPIHARFLEESDSEQTSTPTAASRPETPTTSTVVPPAVKIEEHEMPAVHYTRRFSSPLSELSELDDEEPKPVQEVSVVVQLSHRFSSPLTESDSGEADASPLMDDDGLHPPASSSPDMFLSPAAGPQLELSAEPVDVAPGTITQESEEKASANVDMSVDDAVVLSPPSKDVKKLFSFGVGPMAAAAGNPVKKRKVNGDASSQAGPSASPSKIPMPSPTKMSSFANPTKASAARASVTKTPTKNKPVSAAAAPSGSPSPTKNKLARASSLFTARPPPSFTRTFTGPGNTSSLQTLASALEKLRMPPPERPNTSMGFSKDDTDHTLAESTRSADARSIGIGRPSGGLQRASTVASIGSASSSTSSLPGDSLKASTSAAPPLKSALVQRPLSAFMNAKGAGAGGASNLAVGTGSIMRGGPSVFGAGRGRSAPKVSRNPGLPSVIASPVKGTGDGDDTMLEEELMPGVDEGLETRDAPTTERVTSPRGKGKEKERLPEEWRQNASRRASMAGQDLSKSVSLPPKPVGIMGPPETPLDRVGMRSSSSSYPSSSSDPSGSAGEGMRRSTRIAKSAAETSVGDDDVSTTETQRPAPTPVQPLTILKGCIVFVDIISEVGDDSARSFITDMLKNLGARVLGSVGATCTHIVYKNGLRSTYNRYKALPDPKPHVVGMEWVVQSAEKRNHEDETPYLIDMDDMNTTAIKRRKSMLPRLMSGGMDDSMDGDHSFESSSSSMMMDDELGHLAPLERARLRKAGTLGI